MSLRFALKFCLASLIALVLLGSHSSYAQQPAGATVRGLVADPDNAVIPGATVTLTAPTGKALTATSGSDGTYLIRGVAPGSYSLTVTMNGFASFVKQGIRLTAGQTLAQDAKLVIQTQEQQVQVSTSAAQLSVDSDSNASATVIKGADLDALSDDPDELSSELSALAGPAAGPNGGQIYVDGFTGGQLPPKSSIREIRVNQNPFSAQYDRLGFGRVEILTKPGTDKFHGSAQIQGNDSSFNTGNPFVTTQPPYHTIFFLGNLTGPINSRASFTVGGSRRQIQNNEIVNGTIFANPATPTVLCQPGDSTCTATPFQTALTAPQTRWDISPRVDFAVTEKNTLTTRLQYENNDITNTGSNFSLASTGSDSKSSESTVQISDTQIISAHVINETRFEYQLQKATATPFSTAPSVSVSGSFTGGGATTGSSSDRTTHVEIQNYTSVQLAKNFLRMGGRLRYNRDANTTRAGTNGTFAYDCLLTADCAPISATYPVQYSYQAGRASQFNGSIINSPVVASVTDVGLYAEDDWKAKPNLTLSFGFRYETQGHIGEHHDFAPRVSFAYGLGSAKGSPKTVLRGGFGIFYDRFNIGNVLVPLQQDGKNQQRYTLKNPAFSCNPQNVSACFATGSGNTITTIAPNLRTPYTLMFALGADQQLFRGATVSVNYLRAQAEHEFYTQNINAPFQGQPAPPSGAAVNNQYQSGGLFRQNQMTLNFNVRYRRFSMFGYYALNFAKSNTSGFSSFPSVPYNIGADYGRASFDVRNRVFLGGTVNLPYLIVLSPLIVAQSGNPYNVVTGTDLNYDNTYNDRPTFKPGISSASCNDGSSFAVPSAGAIYSPIPINYCTGPSQFTTNLRVAKTFGFGVRAGDRGANSGGQGGPGGMGGPGGPGGPGGRGGGGGGRGGPGGGGPGGGASSGKRYNLIFAVQVQNLFNSTNYGAPGGNLNSPRLFGRSTQLAGGIYGSPAAKQRTTLQMSFNF